jgi:hypothetical protein
MNTFVISNKGLVDPQDLCLIGSSTKRGDDTKIGMFGSGWKYALAWFLRNDIDIKVFSGLSQIEIDCDIVLHRNKPVRVLTVNGEKTSITAEMGPQWTGWMALREMVSNAIDEGDDNVRTAFNETPRGISDKTTVHIPLNNELNEVVRNYDYYFAFDRIPTHTNQYGRVFLKSEAKKQNIYRKGIRCYDNPKKFSRLDFDFNDLDINESRVSESYSVRNAKQRLLHEVPANILLIAILEKEVDTYPTSHNCEQVKVLVDQGYNFVSALETKMFGMLQSNNKDITLTDDWYRKLVSRGIITTSGVNMGDFLYIETDVINVAEVMYHLEGIGFGGVVVKCGQFDNEWVSIRAIDSNTYIIKDSTNYSSTKELAAKIVKMLPASIIEQLFV